MSFLLPRTVDHSSFHTSYHTPSVISLNTVDEDSRAWTFIILISFVILLSTLFEIGQERLYHVLEHRKKHEYLRMLNALFKELTILGFVSLVMMVLVKIGLMHKINVFLLENVFFQQPSLETIQTTASSERSLSEEDGINIAEMFEEVHILIFVVMVVFITLVFLLLLMAQKTQKKFHDGETVVQKEAFAHIDEIRGKWPKLIARFFKIPSIVDTILYRIIRREFFHPSAGDVHPKVRPASFTFSHYLSDCMADLVVDLIEIPATSFLILFLVIVCLEPILASSFGNILYELSMAAVILASLTICLVLYMRKLFRLVLPVEIPTSATYRPPKRLFSGSQYEAVKNSDEEKETVDARWPVGIPSFYNGQNKRSDSNVVKYLCGTKSPNLHESIFIFWKNGPSFLSRTFQIIIFLQSILLAAVLHELLSREFNVYHHVYFLTFHALIILCQVFVLWPYMLFYFTITTSVGQMKRDDKIEDTVMRIVAEQFKKYSVLIYNIKMHAQIYQISQHGDSHYDEFRREMLLKFKSLPVLEQTNILKAFDTYDTDHSGSIEYDELLSCLQSHGDDKQTSISICDSWLSGDGVFSRSSPKGTLLLEDFEILMVILRDISKPLTAASSSQLSSYLRDVLDKSGDGLVSVSEFQSNLPKNVFIYSNMTTYESVLNLFKCVENSAEEDYVPDEVEVPKFVNWLMQFTD